MSDCWTTITRPQGDYEITCQLCGHVGEASAYDDAITIATEHKE